MIVAIEAKQKTEHKPLSEVERMGLYYQDLQHWEIIASIVSSHYLANQHN